MKKILLILFALIIVLPFTVSAVNVPNEERGAVISSDGLLMPEDLYVYPNPVSNHKFIIELGKYFISEIKISNIAGKEVYNKKLAQTVNRYEVLTDNLPNGIYLLRVTSDNSMSRTIKLLIASDR